MSARESHGEEEAPPLHSVLPTGAIKIALQRVICSTSTNSSVLSK